MLVWRDLDEVVLPEAERKKRISEYIITVNTNKSAEKVDQVRAREVLKDSLKYLLLQDQLPFVFKVHDRLERPEFDADTVEQNVTKTKVHVSTEIGKKYHKIHMHAIVQIYHDTVIEMKLKEFRSMLQSEVETRSGGSFGAPYINVRFMKNSHGNALRYIKKDKYSSETLASGYFDDGKYVLY